MSDLRQAAQQALKALEQCGLDDTHRSYEFENAARVALRAALRAALAQEDDPHPPSRHCMCEACKPAFEPTPGPEQEPVAWMVYTEDGKSAYVTDNPHDLVGAYKAFALYTHPPRRESQGLTKEDVAQNLQSRHDAAKLLEERRQEIAQSRREWQGLTTQEAMSLTDTAPKGVFYGCDAGAGLGIWIAAVAAAERALKEKNHG